MAGIAGAVAASAGGGVRVTLLRTFAAMGIILSLAACASGRVLQSNDAVAPSDSWLSSDPMVLTHVRPLHGGQTTTRLEYAKPVRIRLEPGWYEVFFSCNALARNGELAAISMVEHETTRPVHVRAGRRYRAECSKRQFHLLHVEEEGTLDRGARVSCTAGPLAAVYGALPWLAYACDDGRSVALLSSPDNPASPFSFVLRPSDHGVRVQGEGTGDRGATAAAFAELMALDDAALIALYTRTLMAPAPDQP